MGRTYFASLDAPALSLAVATPDGLAWASAHGSVNLELYVPATTDHRFRLGSVSKVITTVAAARLASRGLIELDTPVAYWLPDLPEHHRRTTMRQLFTHTGGVRHFGPQDLDPDAPGGPITHRDYPDRESILALFIDDPLVAEPGTCVSYSSFGYSLAAIVMEAATGQRFLDLVDEEVAKPFAIPSLAADDVRRVVPGRVTGYYTAREIASLARRMPGLGAIPATESCANIGLSNPAFCWAGAGLLASMPDLARFGAALLSGPTSRITDQQRSELFTLYTTATADHPALSLGWRLDNDAHGRARWHHAGTTPGGRCGLVLCPDQGLAVALASNTMMTPGDVLGPASELAAIFGP